METERIALSQQEPNGGWTEVTGCATGAVTCNAACRDAVGHGIGK
jgi:hypothetical protein